MPRSESQEDKSILSLAVSGKSPAVWDDSDGVAPLRDSWEHVVTGNSADSHEGMGSSRASGGMDWQALNLDVNFRFAHNPSSAPHWSSVHLRDLDSPDIP